MRYVTPRSGISSLDELLFWYMVTSRYFASEFMTCTAFQSVEKAVMYVGFLTNHVSGAHFRPQVGMSSNAGTGQHIFALVTTAQK